ncbi:MAG: SDR family oxidoreductase [Rhodospirillales bacterium]|jgi:3-oxoacyl-[acyl-carrier protein] reductase|nr:SDR family oxidoreductase [Rhodospirillales bacterium]
MELGLKDKGVVVTGASKGIGKAIAIGMAREGANVSICARGAEALEETRNELLSFGGTVHAAQCDVSDANALKQYFCEAKDALGELHVLVNNPSGFGTDDDEEGWRKSIDVDLMALVRASWQAIPMIEAAGGGSLIHISSISGMTGANSLPPYGAIKAAVIHLTSTHAAELAPKNIRVNCIAPGSILFDGGVWDDNKINHPEFYEEELANCPFGRMGTPEEIANLAVFLASDAANWITGQTIAADGGQMLG